MPRQQPPSPKERPVALAVSQAPRLSNTAEARGGRSSEAISAAVFMVLIVLGLIAAARAILVM